MADKQRPNILFILTDDQRFDTIHALGNPQIQTPNLDRLCKEGTAFTNAHIPSGTCGAVCMPSRAMLNTGRVLYHLEDNGSRIPPEHKTMPETFRNHGYTTYHTGKWHNGAEAFARSFTAGDEIFFGGMWDHWNVPTYDFDPTGKYEHVIRVCTNPFSANSTCSLLATHSHAGLHSTDLFSQKALDFLDSYDSDAPFYMNVAFMAPHDPRTMPEQFRNMYKAEDIELPPNFTGMHFDYGIYNMRDEILEDYPRDPHKVRQHIADYYAMISHVDYRIGLLLDKLKEKGLYENTIVIFAADNGLSVGQHGLMGKQNCYEHSIRVPLIFRGPGIPADRRCDSFVYLLDIFPTLCALTGIACPDSVDGKDFSALLTDPNARIRDTIYAAYADKIRAVKDSRYKLVEYRSESLAPVINDRGGTPGSKITATKMTQLFDLQQDPWETHNLASLPQYEEIVEQFRRKMAEYRDQWDELSHPDASHFWDKY